MFLVIKKWWKMFGLQESVQIEPDQLIFISGTGKGKLTPCSPNEEQRDLIIKLIELGVYLDASILQSQYADNWQIRLKEFASKTTEKKPHIISLDGFRKRELYRG